MWDTRILNGILLYVSEFVSFMDPALANLSAISFPSYPLCPGIQFTVTLFDLPRLFNISWQSWIISFRVILFCSDFITACESV